MTDSQTSDSKNVTMIGLGVMGGPIARHIARAGHRLTIYSRGPQRLDAWRAAHPDLAITAAGSPAEAAATADMVITCVGNDDDLAEVVLGPQGAFSTLKPGGIFVDHTTVSARIARQIAVEARDLHIHCVDAPMTGSQIGAENATLTLMCGGRPDAIAAATPVMQAYAQRIVHVGKAGAGQSCKMANQICIAGAIAGVAEALRLAQAAHLDLDKVFEAISHGAAQSWQLDNRLADHGAGQLRLRLCGGLDAQGPGAGAGRRARAGAVAADHRAGRSILCRCPGAGRRPRGYQRDHPPLAAQRP